MLSPVGSCRPHTSLLGNQEDWVIYYGYVDSRVETTCNGTFRRWRKGFEGIQVGLEVPGPLCLLSLRFFSVCQPPSWHTLREVHLETRREIDVLSQHEKKVGEVVWGMFIC